MKTHACQARDNPGCTLHAPEGSDLCPSCAAIPGLRRIAKPTWDANGRRISYGESDLVRMLKSRVRRAEPEEIAL